MDGNGCPVQKDAVETRDLLFGGSLVLCQDRKGYRFSIDAVLLAGLTRVKAKDRVMELGTGCGVVLLALAARNLGVHWEGVEIQPRLAFLARKNVDANGLAGRVFIHAMDWKDAPRIFPAHGFDLVVSNPPYRRPLSGRINPDAQKAAARHELRGSMEDMFACAAHLLKHGGRCAVIYPASRLDDAMVAAVGAGFRPKRLTLIHSHAEAPATLVHLECVKGAGQELHVAPPFFIYDGHGRYTAAMMRLHQGLLHAASND
uniref:tRNA1(Val) (Adenine(37)-N6)-methyltransferase n=1 Tax=Desulfacinum infernum TaxID=35837 RepID=A0A832A3E0_9BACT